jgi:hypothetical protein
MLINLFKIKCKKRTQVLYFLKDDEFKMSIIIEDSNDDKDIESQFLENKDLKIYYKLTFGETEILKNN